MVTKWLLGANLELVRPLSRARSVMQAVGAVQKDIPPIPRYR